LEEAVKRKTLLGAVLRLHVAVVACTCLLLVAGTMATAAYFLQSDQRDSLRSIADAACRGITREQKVIGGSYEEAAGVFLREAEMEGVRVEVYGRDGGLLAAQGHLDAWTGTEATALASGGCAARSVPVGRGSWIDYAFCTRSCDDDHAARAITRHALDQHDVRRAAVALLLLLPAAVLAGAMAGRFGIARLLRPLLALRGAVARLDSRLDSHPGQSLQVGAELEELATLEQAFNDLLRRLGDTIEREKRFTQEASHELRTPLTVLRARLELLAAKVRRQPDLAEVLGLALRDLESIDRLIEALLVLARSDAERFPVQPVNICDLAREVAQVQAGTDSRGSPPPEVEAPDEILVSGNEELLGRALANVVENARKYGGKEALIRIRASESATCGVLIVEDAGGGIDPALRPFVFERFSRGSDRRNQVPGSGLGLAVVKTIVERHGGTVDTGPSALGGEAVRLVLPLLASGGSGARTAIGR
jgi:signal transduction histidine kinase